MLWLLRTVECVASQHGGGQQLHPVGSHSAATASATTCDVTWRYLITETASASQQQTSAGKSHCIHLTYLSRARSCLMNQKVQYHLHKVSPPVTAISSQINQVILSDSSTSLHILISTSQLRLGPAKRLLPSGFIIKIAYAFLIAPCVLRCSPISSCLLS